MCSSKYCHRNNNHKYANHVILSDYNHNKVAILSKLICPVTMYHYECNQNRDTFLNAFMFTDFLHSPQHGSQYSSVVNSSPVVNSSSVVTSSPVVNSSSVVTSSPVAQW